MWRSKGNFKVVALHLPLTREVQAIKMTNDSTQHSTNGFNSHLILVVCFIVMLQRHCELSDGSGWYNNVKLGCCSLYYTGKR